MKIVEAESFKSENARSGFESTGLWPLDRSKINKEKTGGTIHHLALTLSTPSTPTRLTNIDDTTPFAMPSTTTNTPVTISTTSRVSTPRYSNKQIKTNNLLSELNSIIQVNCSILSSNISESVLAVINKAKARPERASFTLTGHCLTSDIAISQMEEREKEQEERLTQLIEKKTEREAKAGSKRFKFKRLKKEKEKQMKQLLRQTLNQKKNPLQNQIILLLLTMKLLKILYLIRYFLKLNIFLAISRLEAVKQLIV